MSASFPPPALIATNRLQGFVRLQQAHVPVADEGNHASIAALCQLRLIAGARSIRRLQIEARRFPTRVPACQMASDDGCGEPFAERRTGQMFTEPVMHTHASPAVERAIRNIASERVTHIDGVGLELA